MEAAEKRPTCSSELIFTVPAHGAKMSPLPEINCVLMCGHARGFHEFSVFFQHSITFIISFGSKEKRGYINPQRDSSGSESKNIITHQHHHCTQCGYWCTPVTLHKIQNNSTADCIFAVPAGGRNLCIGVSELLFLIFL